MAHLINATINQLQNPPIQVTEDIQFALNTLYSVIETLSHAPNLNPTSPYAQTAIGTLDGLCKASFSPEETETLLNIFGQDNLQALHTLLSKAEILSEMYNAQRTDINLYERIHSAYASMVEKEIALIKKHLNPTPDLKCAFVGCGPMPLTSVLIQHFLPCTMHCLESDRQYLPLAQKFLEFHQLSKTIHTLHIQGEHYDFANTDLIYIAGMVTNKSGVFQRIAQTNPNALVITRGGAGLRELFYAKVDCQELEQQGWQCLGITTPPTGIKNTSYLFSYSKKNG